MTLQHAPQLHLKYPDTLYVIINLLDDGVAAAKVSLLHAMKDTVFVLRDDL